MNTIFYLSGSNLNELYTISTPHNIVTFLKYDFSLFLENSTDLCKKYMRTGEYRIEEVVALRNMIAGCHKFYEQNMRSMFEKIVIDCWIDYICRQSEISTNTLWNNFMGCETPFEAAVFTRLSEYRSHRAINQWVNLLKMQDYASKKVDFVFGTRLNGSAEASNRANCFDLMFSVAANEQGYSLKNVGSTRVYKLGRIPNSPFVMSGAAKEIVRNVLGKVRYSDNLPYVSSNEGVVSDQEAMDTFQLIKNHIPDHADNITNTIIKSLANSPKSVYVPSGFKAVIDLEIDMLIESGGFLQRCPRCNEYFLRDSDYDHDYCDRITPDGRTCLEIMDMTFAEQHRDVISGADLALLKTKSDMIFKEMSERVGVDLTQRDMSDWYGYLSGIKSHIMNGEATMEDFDNFIEYSRSISFSAKPRSEEEKPIAIEVKSDLASRIKPYQFQRVDRSEIEQGLLSRPSDDEPAKLPKPQQSFFQQFMPKTEHVEPVSAAKPTAAEAPPAAKIIHSDAVNVREFHNDFAEPAKAPQSVQPEKPFVDDTKVYSKPQPEPPEPDDVKIYEKPKIIEKSVDEVLKNDGGKAVHVVNAYRSTTKIPVQIIDEPEKKPSSEPKTSIDFSRILEGIERTDGFEDDIPTDADGVPLSHKTKHVMDAIMKPSKLSPSLRRPPSDENQ